MEGIVASSLIFDLICLVLVLVIARRYARKGLLASLVEGVGTLASLIGAKLASAWAAPQIFNQWFAPGLRTRVLEKLASGGNVDLNALVAELEGFLPQSVIQSVVEPVKEQLETAFSSNLGTLADTLMDQLITPLMMPIVAIVIFFLVFVLLRMVVSVVAHTLTHVNGIPLLGAANKSLGFVAGGAVGLLYLFVMLCAVWALITITGGRLPYLDDTLLTGSIFYRIFGAINPFTA